MSTTILSAYLKECLGYDINVVPGWKTKRLKKKTTGNTFKSNAKLRTKVKEDGPTSTH